MSLMGGSREVTIVVKKRPDGRSEIFCVAAGSDREVRTGLVAGPDSASVRERVRQLRETLVRSGNSVTVTEC